VCKQDTDFEMVGRTASNEPTPTILKKEGGTYIAPKQRMVVRLKCLTCGGVVQDTYVQGRIIGTDIPKPAKPPVAKESKDGANVPAKKEEVKKEEVKATKEEKKK